jgi:crotonobetainyl-CoA:carnitine CoA-transferase CaiB-like acyl-CoA transferase
MMAGPTTARRNPLPTLGQHTDEILAEVLGIVEETRRKLRANDII